MNRSNFIKLFFSIFSFPLIANTLKIKFTISKKLLIGKGDPLLVGDDFKLLPEVAIAYLKMKEAAGKENIKLGIISGYRSFHHQKKIWNRKFKQNLNMGIKGHESINKIIEYSTIPGTSRHHWGTDIDLIEMNHNEKGDVLMPSLFHDSGPFNKLRIWMDQNASKFGFYKVYTNDLSRKGFFYEPWHFSYRKISILFLNEYLKIDIETILKDEDDLLGKEYLNKSFLNKYIKENIKGVSKELM